MLGLFRLASGMLLLAPRRFEEVSDGTRKRQSGRAASVSLRFS
jgi:hypothetical protein